MHDRNTSFIIFQNGACILLLFIGLSFISSPTCADQTLYTLEELSTGGSVYFYKAFDTGIVVNNCQIYNSAKTGDSTENSNKDICLQGRNNDENSDTSSEYRSPIYSFPESPQTNVLVWAKKGKLTEDSIQSLVNKWRDIVGFTHSVMVLKQQLAFNNDFTDYLEKSGLAGADSIDFCPEGYNKIDDLWFATERNDYCIHIKPVLVTGILDQPTLMIPYSRALMKFNLSYERWAKHCLPQKAPCIALGKELLSLSARIKDLSTLLSAAPLIDPGEPDSAYVQRASYPGDGFILPLSDFNHNVTCVLLNNNRCIIRPDSKSDNFVYQSVDPTAIDDEFLDHVETEEKGINTAMEDEEYAADAVFGVKYPQ